MKTYRNLFESVTAPASVLAAFYRDRRGKRYRPLADAFYRRLEENVLSLSEDLRSGSYRPGGYRNFLIREPKARLVSAAPFRAIRQACCRPVGAGLQTRPD